MGFLWKSFSVLAVGLLLVYILVLGLLLVQVTWRAYKTLRNYAEMLFCVLTCISSFKPTGEDARQVLRYYDPELGKPLPERTYAEDCRVYTPEHPDGALANIVDKMDIFVPAHFLGWYIKVIEEHC